MHRKVAREQKSIGCLDSEQDSAGGWAEGRKGWLLLESPLSPDSMPPTASVTGLWQQTRSSSRILYLLI